MTTQTEAQRLADLQDAGYFKEWRQTAAELRRLEAANKELLELIEHTAYKLEQSRIWNGTEWHYTPLHPIHYRPLSEKLKAAQEKHGGAK